MTINLHAFVYLQAVSVPLDCRSTQIKPGAFETLPRSARLQCRPLFHQLQELAAQREAAAYPFVSDAAASAAAAAGGAVVFVPAAFVGPKEIVFDEL